MKHFQKLHIFHILFISRRSTHLPCNIPKCISKLIQEAFFMNMMNPCVTCLFVCLQLPFISGQIASFM